MTQLKCENVSLGYEGHAVVSGLTFDVHEGDYLCVVGENGTGKSTLIKTLLGLIPQLDGKIVRSEGLSAKDIGYMPQQTSFQRDFPASVGEIVISGCLGHCAGKPFYGKNERALARRSMERLAIYNLKRRCYRELSGGQQQRVLLARALCATSRLLVLDEPASGLDPKATAELYDVIEDLNRTDGITIIMVSHDLRSSVKYASHILHLSAVPLFFGTREAYVRSDIGRTFLAQAGDADNG